MDLQQWIEMSPPSPFFPVMATLGPFSFFPLRPEEEVDPRALAAVGRSEEVQTASGLRRREGLARDRFDNS